MKKTFQYLLLGFFQVFGVLALAQTPFHVPSKLPQECVYFFSEEEKEQTEGFFSKQFIEDIYYPQTGLTSLQQAEIEQALAQMPKDPCEKMRAPGWEFRGPDFINNNNHPNDPKYRKWSGRVPAIEYSTVLRASGASGGLYEGMVIAGIPIWYPISDSLPSRAISAFATNPLNSKTIVAGTGEFSFAGSPISPAITPYGAAGIWKTQDGGATWNKANSTPSVDNVPFEKIAYHPNDSIWMYAAGLNGAYYSTDGGDNWFQIPPPTTSTIATDIAVASDGSHVLIGYVRNLFAGTGVPSCAYYSNTILTTPQFLTNDFVVQGKQPADVKLAYSASNPAIAYASCFYFATSATPDTTSVIFRSTQYGAPNTWQKCNIFDVQQQPVLGFHWGAQGFRDNIIGVSPTNPNKVVAGGGPSFYSYDGFNFYQTDAEHADQCAITWKPDGSQAFLGNDGGIFFSNDDGMNWQGDINYLPITQCYFLDVDPQNPQKIICGTQDNGILIYNTTSNAWEYAYGGDGGDCVFHPTNPNNVYGTIGGADFVRCKSTASGVETTWQDIETNVSHTGQSQFNSPIATDFVSANYLYSGHGTLAYISLDYATWTPLNPLAPFTNACREMAVGTGFNPHVYFALRPDFSGNIPRLDVDGSPYTMTTIASPTLNAYPRAFWAELPNTEEVYCAMGGVNTTATKVYKSLNAGAVWQNITGDLPANFPPITDIWANPSNTQNIVISTERGCFKTDNGGTNWYQWSYGLPKNLLVTDIDYAYENGKVYAYIATFGRGVWRREVTEADPVSVSQPEDARDSRLICYPNPTQNEVNIAIYLPKSAEVKLSITNSHGQIVLQRVEKEAVGNKNWTIDIHSLPAGIYFCEFTYLNQRKTAKIVKE
ncbi:MAG: T9SS type A sorting domain-containing protein [Bacteroidia bacterium]